jgi:hypothetical protein
MDTRKILFESAEQVLSSKAKDWNGQLLSAEHKKEIESFYKTSVAMQEPFFMNFVENYQKHLEEAGEPEKGALRGQTYGDMFAAGAGMYVAATLEIFNACIRGFMRYMDDSFVRKFTTDSVVWKMPLVEYQEYVAGIDTTGQLPHTEKQISYASVDLSNPESERGGKVTWTRALLEDVTFDVQAEMAEGLGHAIAKKIMADIIKTLLTVDGSSMPHGSLETISASIAWSEFLAVIGDVDKGVITAEDTDTGEETWKTYGPPDYCLVSPDVYWQLLNIIQLTNVLYEGSTDPINRGNIKLALGCTISKQSLLPAGCIIALNSQKAIALVSRRALKIEPVLFPVWNEYGFIGTVRYGVTILYPLSIQIGAVSALVTDLTSDETG